MTLDLLGLRISILSLHHLEKMSKDVLKYRAIVGRGNMIIYFDVVRIPQKTIMKQNRTDIIDGKVK